MAQTLVNICMDEESKKSMEQIRQELVTLGNCALTESKVYFWRAFPVTIILCFNTKNRAVNLFYSFPALL